LDATWRACADRRRADPTPLNLNPEILATLEHLHSGGFATTRDQAKRVSITDESRVLDVGCGIGGPARYLAHTYGCRVDGIDLTPELIETGRVLTERWKLADRVVLQALSARARWFCGSCWHSCE